MASSKGASPAGNASDYVALGNRAAADLGTGVMSLNGTHDVGFLVSSCGAIKRSSLSLTVPIAASRLDLEALLPHQAAHNFQASSSMLKVQCQAAACLVTPVTAAEYACRCTFLTGPPLPRVRTPVLCNRSCSVRRRSASCGTNRTWAHTEAFRPAVHPGGQHCCSHPPPAHGVGVDSITTKMRH